MPAITTVLAIAGLGLSAAAFFAGGGGDSSPNDGKRIVPPKSSKEKKAAKTVLCNCYRSGVQDFDSLVSCALGSIYPGADLDWQRASTDAQTDGVLVPETEAAVRLVRKWATNLLLLQTEKERMAWCAKAEPKDDDGDLLPPAPPGPAPTPPGPGPGPAPTPPGPGPGPAPMPEGQRVARVQELYSALRMPNGKKPRGGGGYWRPTYQTSPTNMLDTAKEVLRDYGVASPTNAQRSAFVRLIEASDWNRGLYGRNAKDNETLQYDGKTARTAFNPRHKDADVAILGSARRPVRNIRNDGSKKGAGNKFGVLWLPGISAALLESSDIIVADPATAEPPGELLTLLDAAP